ncbi:ROK family protein [Virgisporangium ochraceum]|uniref:Glucokinase n=1 Tax=Virgisporangium ochraceum TaxID=65505 RepID=A0A8J3ZXG9_9ACTN|nr:ROK family protein [Virgisporangium ochraceum]GIJ70983.1 glucokinase [Virgisporangium ochraceum]
MRQIITRVGAFDVGGTHIRGVQVDTAGWRVVPSTAAEFSLPADGSARDLLDGIADCVRAVTTDGPVAIALPAPFDYATGIARYHGVAKFDALNGVDVGAGLRARGVTGPIGFTPDAHAFLRGEAIAGAAAGYDRAMGVTLGTGVGSAFLADGAMVADGPLVPPESRIDLTTVDGAPLEETVSRRALLRAWGSPTGDVADLARLARAGAPAEVEVLRHAFEALGRALAPWVTGFRPGVVVFGGGMSGAWDLIEPPVRAGLAAAGVTAVPHLVRAASAHDAPLLGAAWHAAAVSSAR